MIRKYWFAAVIVVSVVVRLYLAIFTEGTDDALIWARHARWVNAVGLTAYYKVTVGYSDVFNHPPLAGIVVAGIGALADQVHIPLKIPFRLILSALDYVAAYYLFKIFAGSDRKHFYVAFYLLNPLTIIFSAYHHNTDSLVGLLLLMSVYYAGRKNYAAAGLAIGIGLSIKWIILLALPAIFFSIHGLRPKATFLAVLSLLAALGYGWYAVNEPSVLTRNLFGYTGQLIHTESGIPVWGNRIFLAQLMGLLHIDGLAFLIGFVKYNNVITMSVIIVYSWLYRNRTGAVDVGRTVGEVFVLFYALTNYWAFQYFAWSLPFLMFLPLPLMAAISFFASGYIYLLYATVCDSYWLLGKWDFAQYSQLSAVILFFRDASLAAFIGAMIFFAFRAVSRQRFFGAAPA